MKLAPRDGRKAHHNRISQHTVVQLVVKMYRYRGRATKITFDRPLPPPQSRPPRIYKNIITEAMKVREYLEADPARSFFHASQHFGVTRSWISQLMTLADNLPEEFLNNMRFSTDQILLKRFTGKTLKRIAKLKTVSERQKILNQMLNE